MQPPLQCRHPTINPKDLSTDPPRTLATQKYKHICNLSRLANAIVWTETRDRLEELFALAFEEEIGRCWAWRNGVD